MYESVFDVPPIPDAFDAETMTYYDYFNIYWRANPDGGWMNQFVPQLMLGNALCNSSNAPDYHPHWAKLTGWAIGAQYFFGVCDEGSDGAYNCTAQSWTDKAATGALVPVEEGELIYTKFELSDEYVWTLSMGVVGDETGARSSVVVVDRPFMGLVNTSTSWAEPTYDEVYAGACWEDYNMAPGSYPKFWHHNVTVVSNAPGDWWNAWQLDASPTCSWAPDQTIDDAVSDDNATQVAHWNIFYDDDDAA